MILIPKRDTGWSLIREEVDMTDGETAKLISVAERMDFLIAPGFMPDEYFLKFPSGKIAVLEDIDALIRFLRNALTKG